MTETTEITSNDAKYDLLFDQAYLFATTKESPFAVALGKLIFSICNGYEQDPRSFPPKVLDAAHELAIEWTTLVEAKSLDEVLLTEGGDPEGENLRYNKGE